MRNVFIIMSIAAMFAAMTACTTSEKQAKAAMYEPFRQEREFMRKAIQERSPDVQRVDIIGNTVVYTQIYDGIIDMKTYTYDNWSCYNRWKKLHHSVNTYKLYYNRQHKIQ